MKNIDLKQFHLLTVLLLPFLFMSCDSLFINRYEKEIGRLDNAVKGRLLIKVELSEQINLWHINFGDYENWDKIKKIDGEVLNQYVSVSIVN